MSNPARDVTRVLDQVRAGEPDAPQCLVDMVYEELRWMAEKDMRGEPSRHRRQPTQLVREAYLRLVGTDKFLRQNRAHFFAAAAEAMRRILVERSMGHWSNPFCPTPKPRDAPAPTYFSM